MFSDWIRRIGFWTLDLLRGGQVRANYKDIKARMASETPNAEQLKQLLRHAVSTTPFYKNCAAADFYSFPIINKNDIKSCWDDMHSEKYRGQPVHLMSTSGSTGTPFTMEWDLGKRKRQLAGTLSGGEQQMLAVGRALMGKPKMIWTEVGAALYLLPGVD